jgi:hypothetical protein
MQFSFTGVHKHKTHTQWNNTSLHTTFQSEIQRPQHISVYCSKQPIPSMHQSPQLILLDLISRPLMSRRKCSTSTPCSSIISLAGVCLTFKRLTFAYAKAECTDSHTNIHILVCECICCNAGKSISLSLKSQTLCRNIFHRQYS